MPFNCLGDLYKAEIVDLLRKKGCDIKNVHGLICLFDARIVQRLLDKPQHKLPLAELFAGTLCLAVEVALDPLEQILRDLKRHGSGSVHFLSFFLLIVFCDERRDILAQRFSGLLLFRPHSGVQGFRDLRAEILGCFHAVSPFPDLQAKYSGKLRR